MSDWKLVAQWGPWRTMTCSDSTRVVLEGETKDLLGGKGWALSDEWEYALKCLVRMIEDGQLDLRAPNKEGQITNKTNGRRP